MRKWLRDPWLSEKTLKIGDRFVPELIQVIGIFEYWMLAVVSLGIVEYIPQCPMKGCGKDMDRHSIANHIRHYHLLGTVR